MTYSLLPHDGPFSVERVVRPAYELNVAPIPVSVAADVEGLRSMLSLDNPNVIVEAVKWAEEGDAFIVRLYEAGKGSVRARLTLAMPVESIVETDLA